MSFRFFRPVLALAVIVGVLAVPASASAKSCAPVVKKIYSLEGFYKAKVLVTSGSVPCSEARKIIWKALKPGGFNGGINGWQCQSKGDFDPFIEKCSREDPRVVIKSGKPRLQH
jgi:hypothetical protein